jgi:kumamolisin
MNFRRYLSFGFAYALIAAAASGCADSNNGAQALGGLPGLDTLDEDRPTSPTDPDANDPIVTSDGLPAPLPGVYTDLGPAPLNNGFRALMGFPLRNVDLLQQAITDMYNPAHPSFRQYMTPIDFMSSFGPAAVNVASVKQWIESQGMAVPRVASNAMLLEFTGTVAQFNTAFQTELRLFSRKNPQHGRPPIEVYGTTTPIIMPKWISERVRGVVTCDLPASTKPLPNEAGAISASPPPQVGKGLTAAKIASAYGVDDLYQMGFKGQGVKLGVVVGATFKFIDLQSFWQSFGITRQDPTTVVTMEPIATRYLETTLDTEWAGAIAPEAELIVYQGPDARNTSMVYTFNEAIGIGEASVITDSFAHREDSEPKLVREQYSMSAMMGAALGITIVAASGDSGETDTPSSSPYVTGVGGTQLKFLAGGNIKETAWPGSGSGPAMSFELPDWQAGVVNGSNKRAVADVALAASPSSPYWMYYLGEWKRYGGTSFSAPVFGALMAVVNSYRIANGLPRAGYLNSILYSTPAVQATFRDVTQGSTAYYAAGPGWDYPTGWGAPSALGLAQTLP